MADDDTPGHTANTTSREASDGPSSDRESPGDGPGRRQAVGHPRGTLPAGVALALVPWTVVVYPAGVDFLFPWGLVNSNPWHLTPLSTYLTVYTAGFESLPPRLQAWPVATGLLALALSSVVVSRLRPGLEDGRVTAGLLALAGGVHLQVTVGLARVGERSIPVGAVLSLGLAWWLYTRARARTDRGD